MKISDIFSKLKEKDLPVAKIEEIVITECAGMNCFQKTRKLFTS